MVQGQNNITGLVAGNNQIETVEHKSWDLLHLFDNTTYSNADIAEGGFAGINLNNINEITRNVEQLIIKPVSEILEGFGGTEETVHKGLKGKAADAATEYIAQVKALLNAYITTYNGFINLAGQAANAYVENDAGNKANIENASQQIQQMAKDMSVEAQDINIDF